VTYRTRFSLPPAIRRGLLRRFRTGAQPHLPHRGNETVRGCAYSRRLRPRKFGDMGPDFLNGLKRWQVCQGYTYECHIQKVAPDHCDQRGAGVVGLCSRPCPNHLRWFAREQFLQSGGHNARSRHCRAHDAWGHNSADKTASGRWSAGPQWAWYHDAWNRPTGRDSAGSVASVFDWALIPMDEKKKTNGRL